MNFITRLPILTKENLDTVMAECLATVKNDITSIPMLWQGMLEMQIPVGDTVRTAKLYVPQNTPQCETFVFLNVPDDKNPVDFLQRSGWLACSDARSLPLFVTEPEEGGWRSPAEEQAYFDACAAAVFGGIYIRGGMSVYVVGYGEIGCCLHRYVMDTPLRTAAAVFLDASCLESTWIDEAEAASLDGGEMRFDIPKKDIPVPIWLIDRPGEGNARAVTHWQKAIQAGEPREDSVLGRVWPQTRDIVCTPDGPIACLSVKESDDDRTAPAMTEAICNFLRRFSRYNKFGPYGNSLVPFIDFEKKGVEIRRFPDENGNLRPCLIYVPKAFTDKEKLPLVFAIHGSSESVRNYFEESLLYRQADKEGFILVMPETQLYPMPDELSGGTPMAHRPRWEFCSAWTMNDAGTANRDLSYFDQILTAILAEYPVDEKRMYGTGHSNGFMMTSLLASSPLGSRFAAIAVTSGVTTAWDETGTAQVPVYMTMGEYDLWSYRLADENGLTAGIDRWLIRHGLADEESVQALRVSGASETGVDGRHHISVWKDVHDLPRVRYDWIEKKDHMNTADENERFWDEWFSRWRFNEAGVRCYKGRPMEEEGT